MQQNYACTKSTLKKHLLFSSEFESSTDRVLEWLHCFGQNFQRINSAEILDKRLDVSIANHTGDVSTSKNKDEFASIWYRKVRGVSQIDLLDSKTIKDKKFQGQSGHFNDYIRSERTALCTFQNTQYQSKKILAPYEGIASNKLLVLNRATDFGIDVPDTLITCRRASLEAFLEKHPNGIINKSIHDHLFFNSDQVELGFFSNYTEEITPEICQALPEAFSFSLFQEKLNKAFEIRTFYLDGDFSSMAIFSQNNQQTMVDFRRYDKKLPNRVARYQLPAALEKKLGILLKEINMNTGSIDLIKTKEGRFVFLEINPSGQYGMVSYPCNYNLDKKIAKFLINESA